MKCALTIGLMLLACSVSQAAVIGVSGDLSWTGEPTPDGSTTWPAELIMDFGTAGDYTTATAALNSTGYSGQWLMTDLGMTSGNSRFFTSDDGEATISLEMNPLSELSEDTLSNIIDMELSWANPIYNEEAPVSFLQIQGAPSALVPEPNAAWLVLLAALGMMGLVMR